MNTQYNKEELITNFKEHLLTQSELEYLKKLETDELKKLESELENYIHKTNEAQKPVYQVLAQITKFVPNFILAKLSHDFLTPFIISQVTLYLSVKSSASIAKSLRADFLGEVTLYNEPKLSADIGKAMGMPYLYHISREILNKGFYLRMAEILEFIPDREVRSIFGKIKNPEQIASLLQYMENSPKVELILSNLNDAAKNTVKEKLAQFSQAGF